MIKELANQNFFLAKLENFIRSQPIIYVIVRYLIGKYLYKYFHESDLYGLKNFRSDSSGLILDIGSNDGVSSKLFHYFFKNMKISAFEPLSFFNSDYTKLSKKNITLYNYAISDKNFKSEIYCPYFLFFGKRFYLSAYSSQTLEDLKYSIKSFKLKKNLFIEKFYIECKPLEYDNIDKIFLIKIDTNGHELAIIKHLLPVLKQNKPLLILEIGKDIDEITSILNGLKYEKMYFHKKKNFFSKENTHNSINAFFINSDHYNFINKKLNL